MNTYMVDLTIRAAVASKGKTEAMEFIGDSVASSLCVDECEFAVVTIDNATILPNEKGEDK